MNNNYKKQFGILPDILVVCVAMVVFSGCKKYLDEKSDKQLVVPVTLADAQALLDNYPGINNSYPGAGALSDDDVYFTDSYYNSLSSLYQNVYTWDKDAIADNDWNNMYKTILAANLALETADRVAETNQNKPDRDRITGMGLFLRGYAFYHLAQCFALPYDSNMAGSKPGIVLRLSSDVTLSNVRQRMEATYNRIITDLKAAAALLPVFTPLPARPGKAAADGVLSRVYLTTGNHVLAGKYADSALQLNSTLLNYNTLDVNAAAPFTRFNTEVIYAATTTPTLLSVTNYRTDTILYQSYAANDLRKKLFFRTNGTGAGTYYTFKGSYDGTTSGSLFNGITTDEMFLTRAECYARAGNTNAAMSDLNTLLVTRWKSGTYVPYTATGAEDALTKVLTERRKELTGRAIRWNDLRRLNRDNRFAKTLTRLINGTSFTLLPNDGRYTFYIPLSVIAVNGMEQNVR